jgi:enoyl-CoA hydratase
MVAWGVESGHIGVAVQEAVAVVTLRRPDKLNALTTGMRRELAAILRHYGGGDSVRGIVLTGAGRAFSAGLDLREAAALPRGGLAADVELFHDITRAALETRVPVIAAVNGIAVGGACEMTLCFDARIGTPAAEYFLPENNIGLTISNAASVLLPRLAGHQAMRLVMESARISAQDALACGQGDQIVAPTSSRPPSGSFTGGPSPARPRPRTSSCCGRPWPPSSRPSRPRLKPRATPRRPASRPRESAGSSADEMTQLLGSVMERNDPWIASGKVGGRLCLLGTISGRQP